ncbi:MAG: tRNA-dihydrouridine synthase [Microgenomates group bacterium GW2011_GWC1_39_7]|nr:MAG: tRNA-dihydrouridine synthase [Microgenomates group bacterium GW2011_GWC1_39_7]
MNIWKDLPKPIFALAPMEGVTDTVFRQIVASCGKPSVFFTEFTNVDGLFSKGKSKVEHRLIFKPQEKPIIAQLWGMQPHNYSKAAKVIQNMGFDGIDINMGCPQKSVVKRGACAGLIHNKKLAGEIINATKNGSKLPISVKTRIGIDKIETQAWISFLLEQRIDALIIHPRTVREQSNTPAHWEEIKTAVLLRNKIAPQTILIGNGDVISLEEAYKKIEEFGLDGIMMGRGIFRDPFLFNENLSLENLSLGKRLDLLLEHAALFEKTWERYKHFPILKKFFKIYTYGLNNAKETRKMLMEANNYEETVKICSVAKQM